MHLSEAILFHCVGRTKRSLFHTGRCAHYLKFSWTGYHSNQVYYGFVCSWRKTLCDMKEIRLSWLKHEPKAVIWPFLFEIQGGNGRQNLTRTGVLAVLVANLALFSTGQQIECIRIQNQYLFFFAFSCLFIHILAK